MSTLRVSNIEAKADASSPTIDEKVKITSSDGRVLVQIDGKNAGITSIGINTTSTSFTIDGNQNVQFVGVITATSIVVSAGTTALPSISPSGAPNTGVFFPSADTISASTGGTQRITIDSSGNINIDDGGVFYDATNNRLAIGTTSPGRNLHIAGGSNALVIERTDTTTSALLCVAGNNQTEIYSRATNSSTTARSLVIIVGSTEAVRIDTSGRLLVGTSTALSVGEPANALFQVLGRVGGATDVGRLAIARGEAATSITSGEEIGKIYFTDNAGNTFGQIECTADANAGASDFPGRLVFSTTADGASTPTERMRIRSNGETRCFSANGTSTIELRNGASSGTSNRLLYGLHSATDITNGTPIYSIFTNGTIGTPSDIRLKKNVESTRDGYLDDINDLRVVKYHWKTQDDAEPKELGLIAQEVEEVFPGLIHTEGEGDSEVKEIKRSVIPFILLKALQEADAKIEDQQVVINDLLARVTALERA